MSLYRGGENGAAKENIKNKLWEYRSISENKDNYVEVK